MPQPAQAQPLSAAMARHQRRDIPEDELFRMLMQHETWWVPGTMDEEGQLHMQVLGFPDGRRHMQLFTTREALELARAHVRGEGGASLLGERFLTLEGKAAFRFLEPGLDVLSLDPHSPHGLRFLAGDILQLRRWAVVARLEALLEDPEGEEEPWAVLRRYPWYQVVLEGEGEARELLLAPDAAGRRLAAVFTTDGAVEAFLGQVSLEGRAATATVTGEELFVSLKQMAIDGLVFNCCGPTRARAFGAAVIDAILSA